MATDPEMIKLLNKIAYDGEVTARLNAAAWYSRQQEEARKAPSEYRGSTMFINGLAMVEYVSIDSRRSDLTLVWNGAAAGNFLVISSAFKQDVATLVQPYILQNTGAKIDAMIIPYGFVIPSIKTGGAVWVAAFTIAGNIAAAGSGTLTGMESLYEVPSNVPVNRERYHPKPGDVLRSTAQVERIGLVGQQESRITHEGIR